mgnify:CR=1 FL=1
MTTYPIIDHEHDVLVVGAGGAGLRASLPPSQRTFEAKPRCAQESRPCRRRCCGARHRHRRCR